MLWFILSEKPCCVTHRYQGCCCSLTVRNVRVWILFSLPQSSFGILLNAALLFLLSHLLPQQLTDISQRVGFTWERPYCFAEPAGLSLPVKTIKKSGRGFPHRSVVWLSITVRKKENSYSSLRFCERFIWLKSVGSGLFTGLKGGHRTETWGHFNTSRTVDSFF